MSEPQSPRALAALIVVEVWLSHLHWRKAEELADDIAWCRSAAEREKRMQTTYAFWSHNTSGETYAIRQEDGVVTGVCGPLHYSDVDIDSLPDYHYDDHAEDAERVREHEDDYRLKEVV